jgi:hypothetical protein
MFPSVAIVAPQLNTPSSIDLKLGTVKTNRPNSIANWTAQTPLTSPDLHSTPALPKLIAQELPGGNTPSSETPNNRPKTIIDTGKGYPTKLPANYFGPALSFGNGASSFGVVSKFPLGDKFSIRPSATFGSKGTVLRVPVTYDFALGDPEPFESNPVVTFHAGGGVEFSSGGGTVNGDKFSLLGTLGVDVSLFDNIALLADFNTNFGSNSGVTIGVGFEF